MLVVYDYFMTLGREVELFWKGKCRGAAILFYINRYLNLLFSIYELVCIAYIPAQVREARHTLFTGILHYNTVLQEARPPAYAVVYAPGNNVVIVVARRWRRQRR